MTANEAIRMIEVILSMVDEDTPQTPSIDRDLTYKNPNMPDYIMGDFPNKNWNTTSKNS